MKYVVNTDVVSGLMRPGSSDKVVGWFRDHGEDAYLNAVTVKELYCEIMSLSEGEGRSLLHEALTAIVMQFSDSMLSFDAQCGYLCAELQSRAIACGRTPAVEDLMIAAICLRNDAMLVTCSVDDFDYLGIPLLNPFE